MKAESFDTSNGYYGSSYLTYGGNHFLGDFLGAFESFWVVAYLIQLSEIALAPFVIAYLMYMHYVDVSDETARKSFDMIYLYWGFIVAFGAFLGSWALSESAERLIGFFDIQSTDAVEFYKKKFPGDEEPNWNS